MKLNVRLPAVSVCLATIALAAAAPARAQEAAPADSAAPAAPGPESNAPPADPNAPPPGSPPANYGPPPTYGSPAQPAYPPAPPPAYPPPQGYPPQGYAAPPPYGPPPGYGPPGYNLVPAPGNVHDGFFLRLHLGGGFTSISRTDRLGNLKIHGGSASLGVALGGAIAENLILFGNFFMSIADSPNVTQAGVTTSPNASAGLVGLGLGLTYYVMPANVYFSGALALMGFSMSDPNGNDIYSSDGGLGFQGMIGKEWWVSPEWGLGVAGELMVASMKDKNDSSLTWTGSAFSLLFSSTFN